MHRDHTREESIAEFEAFYRELEIEKKFPNLIDIWDIKAMNLAGISLDTETLGKRYLGKFVQILCIGDEDGKRKNFSIGYFGKADSLSDDKIAKIVRFVLLWRIEKVRMNEDHYRTLLYRNKYV